MDLNFSGDALAIGSWSNKHFRQLSRSTTLQLNEISLFNYICQLLLLLLALIGLLLKFRNLLGNIIETVTVGRAIRDRPNEGGVRIFERLIDIVSGRS